MAQLELRPTSKLRVFIIARALNWHFTVCRNKFSVRDNGTDGRSFFDLFYNFRTLVSRINVHMHVHVPKAILRYARAY